jgi:hypothetical protein
MFLQKARKIYTIPINLKNTNYTSPSLAIIIPTKPQEIPLAWRVSPRGLTRLMILILSPVITKNIAGITLTTKTSQTVSTKKRAQRHFYQIYTMLKTLILSTRTRH